MTRNEFEKEVKRVENFYFINFSYENKEMLYKKLHNIPLETILKANREMFAKFNSICTLKEYLSICEHNFSLNKNALLDYMKEDDFFNNDEIEKKARYYVKNKSIPNWLASAMFIYEKQYFKELLEKE